MPILNVGKHTIEVKNTALGTEIVKYDGQLKAKGYSLFGRSYHFVVEEDGQQATYEVEFKAGFLSAHFTVRRNGIVVFSE